VEALRNLLTRLAPHRHARGRKNRAAVVKNPKSQTPNPRSIHGPQRLRDTEDRPVIVEVKAIERLDKIHMAQMLAYLRVTGLHIALILNFYSALLKHGVRSAIL